MRNWSWRSAALVLAVSAAALAQDRLGEATKLGSETEFNQGFGPSSRLLMTELLRGQKPLEAGHAKMVEVAAKYYVWRVTWPELQSNPKKMADDIHNRFKLEIDVAAANLAKNQDARKLFAQKLVAAFKEVFDLPWEKNRMSSLNAAIMLPQLARLKHDVVADFLVSLIADPNKPDFIKHFAVRALPEIFPAQELTIGGGPRNKAVMARRELDIKRIDTLGAFITRKWDKDKADQGAQQFMRLDAIKALGQAMVPVVEANAKAQKIDGLVVYPLLSVLSSKPMLNPPPSLEEKLEAALGLCYLKIDPRSDYQPDLAIYRVGRFVIEYIKEYQKDFNQFAGGDPKSKNRKAPIIPWRVDTDRLQHGLKKLADGTQFNPNLESANKKAAGLEKAAQSYLTTIKSYNAVTSAGRIDNIEALVQAVGLLQPKTQAVFPPIKKEPPIGD